jgi:Cu+-exporting ATPase
MRTMLNALKRRLNPQQPDLLWLLLKINVFFYLPLMVISMGPMLWMAGTGSHIHIPHEGLWQWFLTTCIMLTGGWIFAIRAWEAWQAGRPNMFTLISAGLLGSYVLSVASVLNPSYMHRGFYFETSATLVMTTLLGQYIEHWVKRKTRFHMDALASLVPLQCRRYNAEGLLEWVDSVQVREGEEIWAEPFSRVPVDGVVVEGFSALDVSMLTGESMPVSVQKGSYVYAGSMNTQQGLRIRVEHTNTMVSRMAACIEDAANSKAHIQQWADKVAGVLVPWVFAVAGITFVGWVSHGLDEAVWHALCVLLVTCPCALGLATPVSVRVAAGRAAQWGVLFHHAKALESLAHITTVVCDKTGTLTQGKPHLEHAECFTPHPNTVFDMAAALSSGQPHPLNRALADAFKPQSPSLHTEVLPGLGLKGNIHNHTVFLGNRTWLQEQGFALQPLLETHRHCTPVAMAVDGVHVATFYFSDPLKNDALTAVTFLQQQGLKVIIASGDTQEAVQHVAQTLGVTQSHAHMLPEEKWRLVQTLQKEGQHVAMLGDGINDAAALAAAHVGVAMQSGSDITLNHADITLMNNRMESFAHAFRLSKKTLRNIQQNIAWAFVYNLVAVPVATGVFAKSYGVELNPMWASVAMALSSISVIANALRLHYVE